MTHFEPTEALHAAWMAEDHLSMSIYYDNEAYNERQKRECAHTGETASEHGRACYSMDQLKRVVPSNFAAGEEKSGLRKAIEAARSQVGISGV